MEKDYRPPRLLRTPVPRGDESLMGYVLRLTEENGYDTPDWIFDLAGAKLGAMSGGWPALYGSDFDPGSLAQVLGLERAEFETLRDRTTAGLIPVKLIRFRSPRICPLCLREDSYYRAVWDVLPVTVCAAHRVLLLDRCQQCGKRISWSRKRVSVCRCGFDWRESTAVKPDASTLRCSERVSRLCGLSAGAEPTAEYSANSLLDLELGDLCRALTVIADQYLFAKEGRRVTVDADNPSCHDAFAQAFLTFADWPESYYQFLDWASCRVGKGIQERKFHRLIGRQCDSKPLHFILVALEEHIAKKELSVGGIGPIFPFLFRRFIDGGEACRRLGVRREWLDALIAQGKLDAPRTRHDTGIYVDAESVTRLRVKLGDLNPIWVVARALGINWGDVEDLIREGCLRPFSGPSVDGLPEWKFELDSTTELVDEISDMVLKADLALRGRVVSAGEVIRQLKRRRVGAGRFVRDVLEGKLTPAAARRGCGLLGIAFREEEVFNYIQGVEVIAEVSRPPIHKIWTHLLISLGEQNGLLIPSGRYDPSIITGVIGVEISDLARVAREVFSRTVS